MVMALGLKSQSAYDHYFQATLIRDVPSLAGYYSVHNGKPQLSALSLSRVTRSG